MFTKQVLIDAGIADALAERWLLHLQDTMREFGIVSNNAIAAFLAQTAHESNNFKMTEESFNYSVDGLIATFGRRIDKYASFLGRQSGETKVPVDRQRRIANQVYQLRYGNGDSSSGDGWRYRGRGLKQITFKDNYKAVGYGINVDLLADPDLLNRDDLAARSAGWFWYSVGGNKFIERNDFDGLSTRINGSGITQSSLESRRKKYSLFKKAMGL